MRKRISFVVPSLNEEANLEAAVRDLEIGTQGRVDDYEVLIFNDGSTDRTGEIADRLANKNPRIRVTHHKTPHNLGSCYREGLGQAKFEHYMFVPGDHEFPRYALERMLDHIGAADIVLHYVTNFEVRTRFRRTASHAYTALVNRLFGLDVKYFNGAIIHRTALLRALPACSDGFAYQTEFLVRLIKAGATVESVGCLMEARRGGRSSALRLHNLRNVGKTLAKLYVNLEILKQAPLSRPISEVPDGLPAERPRSPLGSKAKPQFDSRGHHG
jgi:glycosyltransferase involved in cell wall biosynthesis